MSNQRFLQAIFPGVVSLLLLATGCPLFPSPNVTVPNVVDLTQSAAESAITGANLAVGTVTEESHASAPAGQVISQNPAAGASVAQGTAVNLVVSSGPAPVTVPNVVGDTQAAAEAALVAVGLSVGAITEENSDTILAGRVISQIPAAGASVALGTTVDLALSLGPALVDVPNVVGTSQASATLAITDAGLVVGTITEMFSASVPEGDVISQDPLAGTSVEPGSAVDLVISSGTVSVSGRVLFDEDGGAVAGAQVVGSIVTEEAIAALRSAVQQQRSLLDWTHPEAKRGGLLSQLAPLLGTPALQAFTKQSTTTDEEGNYSIELLPEALPSRVLVEVSYQPESLPLVENAKWGLAETDELELEPILIPNAADREIPLTGGAGQSGDGSIIVDDLPAEVDRLFASSYDPDEQPEAFPGEFAEMGTIPLNSSVFLWMEALDAEGNPVDDLSQAAIIRSLVPPTQWVDLEDIQSDTDRIEIPIYVYNEDFDMWEQQGVGWLEDRNRTVLPEDAQSVILDGSFEGDIFATFMTDHFSWMNVDYAYIGPWTLSRLDRDKRNNDCLYQAMQLAKTIAKSAAGRATYAQFNTPGGDLDVELADGAGPELKGGDLGGNYGEFKGNEQGDRDDQLYMGNQVWDGCGEGATEDQKKNTILIMAITLLHESAHWKWDVKHDGGTWTNREPGGEAGNELEKDLFGGIITNGGQIERDGNPVDNATRDGWLDPANWPPPGGKTPVAQPVSGSQPKQSPLELTISLSQTEFELGEEIPVTVEYENVSGQAIRVLKDVALEGYPLAFTIIRDGESTRVPFKGARTKRAIDYEEDFVTLQPGETHEVSVNLLRDAAGKIRYSLITSGNYEMTAMYSGHWGLPETESNAVGFTIGAGGSISGSVTDASSGDPIGGATVKAIQNDEVVTTAISGVDGTYIIPELPAGVYSLEAQASGYLRTSQENVSVVMGENRVVNFSLSPLLTQGELRLVLTWGQVPNDLDSHLWLPMEMPYHIYYSRRGFFDQCPFAALDVDDTSAFGPETITIRQRVLQGTYVYSIYNYSGSPELTQSEAQVQVFDSTGLVTTIDIPQEGTGRFWNVLTIDGATGGITVINEIGDSPEPYPSTDQGCAAAPE